MFYKYFSHNKYLERYYDKNCRNFQDSPKASGWYSRHSQDLRFLAATLIEDLNDQNILDVGCGQADLLDYLKADNISVKYEGIDLSTEMLKKAKIKFPNEKFNRIDLFDPKFQNTYDYVFASGAFSLKLFNQYSYIKKAITKMFSLAKKGIAFNLLSSYAPELMKNKKVFFYYKPSKILNLCFSVSPHVTLYHNYLANDFTIHMYKN